MFRRLNPNTVLVFSDQQRFVHSFSYPLNITHSLIQLSFLSSPPVTRLRFLFSHSLTGSHPHDHLLPVLRHTRLVLLMAYFTSYINPASSPSPPRSRCNMALFQPSSPSRAVNWDDAEAYLSSDLDISFASTMSINSAPSSPTQIGRSVDPFPLRPAPPPVERMEISPAVSRLALPKRTVRINSDASANHRPFGVEVSNVSSPAVADTSPSITKDAIMTRPRSRTTAGLPFIRPPQFERSSTSPKLSPGTTSAGSNARPSTALPNAWLQVPSAISRPSPAVSKRNVAVSVVAFVALLHTNVN